MWTSEMYNEDRYTETECPNCDGDGTTRGGATCTKCEGSGWFNMTASASTDQLPDEAKRFEVASLAGTRGKRIGRFTMTGMLERLGRQGTQATQWFELKLNEATTVTGRDGRLERVTRVK